MTAKPLDDDALEIIRRNAEGDKGPWAATTIRALLATITNLQRQLAEATEAVVARQYKQAEAEMDRDEWKARAEALETALRRVITHMEASNMICNRGDEEVVEDARAALTAADRADAP